MGSKRDWKAIATGGLSEVSTDFLKPPDQPDAPELPPPVEEVDVSGQKQYTKNRLKSRKGRKSTILSTMGSNNQGKKTVLG